MSSGQVTSLPPPCTCHIPSLLWNLGAEHPYLHLTLYILEHWPLGVIISALVRAEGGKTALEGQRENRGDGKHTKDTAQHVEPHCAPWAGRSAWELSKCAADRTHSAWQPLFLWWGQREEVDNCPLVEEVCTRNFLTRCFKFLSLHCPWPPWL